jgi:hypothetical protein
VWEGVEIAGLAVDGGIRWVAVGFCVGVASHFEDFYVKVEGRVKVQEFSDNKVFLTKDRMNIWRLVLKIRILN